MNADLDIKDKFTLKEILENPDILGEKKSLFKQYSPFEMQFPTLTGVTERTYRPKITRLYHKDKLISSSEEPTPSSIENSVGWQYGSAYHLLAQLLKEEEPIGTSDLYEIAIDKGGPGRRAPYYFMFNWTKNVVGDSALVEETTGILDDVHYQNGILTDENEHKLAKAKYKFKESVNLDEYRVEIVTPVELLATPSLPGNSTSPVNNRRAKLK